MRIVNVVSVVTITACLLMAGSAVAQSRGLLPWGASHTDDTPNTEADWAKTIAITRQWVASGSAPPQDVDLVIALSKMEPEGRAIIAAHDQVRARDWSQRYRALNDKMAAIDAKWLAAHPLVVHRLASECLSPMGKNTCAAPPPQQQQRMCQIGGNGAFGLAPC